MTGWQALKAMKEGKSVKRSKWGDRYIYMDKSRVIMDDKECTGWVWNGHEDIFLFDDWEICEFQPGHDFAWALKQILEGKCVKRKKWTIGWKFINGAVQWSDASEHFLFMRADITASDWVLEADDD